MTIGNKIRSRREELGLTQVELAKKAKVTQGSISRIEGNTLIPKATTLMVLAFALNLAPDAFLKDERRAS